VDINSRQAYLAIHNPQGYFLALVNLQTLNENRHFVQGEAPPTLAETQAFVDNRARWMIKGELP
jgi:hypothetical protein